MQLYLPFYLKNKTSQKYKVPIIIEVINIIYYLITYCINKNEISSFLLLI